MTKKEMLGQMDELRSTCVDICTNLWNNPETGGNEQKSADMIRELLHHEGFVIVNEEHLPHAFYAEYGCTSGTFPEMPDHERAGNTGSSRTWMWT